MATVASRPVPTPPRHQIPFQYLLPAAAAAAARALSRSVSKASSLLPLLPPMAMAYLNPVLSSRLIYTQQLASAQPGRYGRAALRSCSFTPTSSSRLACAAVSHGGWRLAAAVEPQAVQQEEGQRQQARTEGKGEAGAEGAAEASSKLVLVVGGTGGVGRTVGDQYLCSLLGLVFLPT